MAKTAWNDLPPIQEVKALVETEACLTLVCEGETFISLAKERIVIIP